MEKTAANESRLFETRPRNPESLLLSAPGLENPLTRQYIKQYSGPGGLSWLGSVMERGGPYLAFIRKEIAERKLPEELVFLPVIESGYLSTAKSKSGAAGLWQFMENSIGPFDMKVNDWIDERRDFWKSTQGALRKLEDNYRQLGDWPLALAAYNAGLGEISRTIQRSGIRDYWELSEKKLLKAETIQYVPKLLAVAYILSNQRQFGIEAQWPVDPKWERVAAERPLDLKLLAKEAGVDLEALIWANRELLHNYIPPGITYYLKIPENDAEKIAAVISNRDITLINNYLHTVHSGDTLFALALRYGVSVDQIMAANPGIEEKFLKIGSRLAIPAIKETAPYEESGATGGGLSGSGASEANIKFEGTHLVKKGETLWSIALAYDIDPEVLAEVNNMGLNDILREGKTLKTPIK
jgi:membrane-bound lytic murein transglycosylase D